MLSHRGMCRGGGIVPYGGSMKMRGIRRGCGIVPYGGRRMMREGGGLLMYGGGVYGYGIIDSAKKLVKKVLPAATDYAKKQAPKAAAALYQSAASGNTDALKKYTGDETRKGVRAGTRLASQQVKALGAGSLNDDLSPGKLGPGAIKYLSERRALSPYESAPAFDRSEVRLLSNIIEGKKILGSGMKRY